VRGRRRWRPSAQDERGGIDARVVEEVRNRALDGGGRLSGPDLAGAVRASGLVVGSGSAAHVIRMLQEDLRGLGPLQEVADRPGTTDVLVDAAGGVWSDGPDGLLPSGVVFDDPDDVRRLAVRLAGAGGRRLDDAQPFADVVMGSYRIHAVLPPVSTGGPLISIRIRGERSGTLADALSGRSRDVWFPTLRAVVAARMNFLVSGGTGTGKTTLLGGMLAEVPPTERILLVEDAQELAPDHPHVVGVQCRGGNIEGAGAVGMAELVRQALRMRPDRLVVGECRGAEVRDFLAAMNTGHDGAGGTIHASSAGAVPARLAAMGALAGMSPAAVAIQAGSALDLVVHMSRSNGERRPVQLSRLLRRGDETLATEPVCLLGGHGGLVPGAGAEWFRAALAERGVEPPW
jgi:pilus assembly protein CpaF